MAEVTVECILDAQVQVGECPVWSAGERALYWADIYGGRLNRFDPATGTNRSWPLGEPLGSFALRAEGGVLVALKSGFHFFDPDMEERAPVASPEAHLPGNRLNDGRCDRAGRFWAGSMADPADAARRAGTLYRVDADRRCTAVLRDHFHVTNGLAFSPDDRVLYVSDSFASVRTIWAYDYDIAEGTVRNGRVFVDTHGMAGRPDGAAVDADGCYWMAANDGWALTRFTPAGRVDRSIKLPIAKPAMLAFGGSDLKTIYVTSIRPQNVDLSDQPLAGGVFAVTGAGIRGLPEPLFAG